MAKMEVLNVQKDGPSPYWTLFFEWWYICINALNQM